MLQWKHTSLVSTDGETKSILIICSITFLVFLSGSRWRFVVRSQFYFGWFEGVIHQSVFFLNVNDSLVCTRESEIEERWDSWYRISRCIYHVNTSVLFSGDPQVTTLLENSHAPPTHIHRENIAKREKSANISITFPMASVQSWSESGFSEKGWVSLRTSSALSKTYSYVERSHNAVVVMLK